ncbi:uncharacterized protein LOC118271023 [Spodoptera frugiperda]|uniref:Uncharacterized protein LOC118271023 n=1 Tax=Spodoptera frugiperda TaxID=7108 RepID=A0A9R0ELY7_SPOFR|nr:uncharacterized protein LOC118271023 [Spodoptera frugiperda]
MLPDSDKKALEKLAKENADLRAQIASLTEIVAGLRNQLNIITSQQHGGNPNSQASTLSVPAGLAPDVEAQLRRSIAIEIGGMMDAKLAALEGRLLPEKTIRPALASDTRRLVVSQPIQEEPTTKPKEIGKKKRKKGKQKGKAVTPAVVELPAVSTSSGQDKHQEIATSQTNNTWSLVVGRKAKKSNAPQPNVSSAPVTQTRVSQKKRPVKLPKVPTSAAITICVKEGATVGLGDVLSAAKRQINIAEFGITADLLREKRAADGGIVIMVSGENCNAKADSLASRMREVLTNFNVTIGRPTKMAEARVMDLDDSVTPEEVATAIARAGECSTSDVKVGEIRRPPTSLGHVWIRGPLAALKKLASEKRMLLGWTSVRVEVLEPRRMMCYRCFEPGHVRRKCTSATDRSAQCYACGGAHKARECTSPTLRCPVCSDQGRPAGHRLGSQACNPQRKKGSNKNPTQASSAALPGASPMEAMDTSHSQP